MYEPNSGPGPAIAAQGLAKRFGDVCAVAGIDLSVPAGSVYGILGPNGAGKSTTVLMLATLVAPSAGSARVLGYDLASEAPTIRRKIGVALQETGLDRAQTASQLLEFVCRLHGAERRAARQRAAELVELVGLTEVAHRRAGSYSGGTRRRLDLALALVHDPRLIYLDEPTTGLDPAARRAIWEEIETLRRRGVTILLTTQYLDEADRLCDRVAIVDRGAIVVEGTPAELRRSLGGDVIEIELQSPQAADHAAEALGEGASVLGERVRLTDRDGRRRIPQVVAALQQRGLHLAGLSLAEPTLDDVFLELTGRPPVPDPHDAPEEVRS
jgi:daunorubicin resistance ABC transporter ATP-binding subunit